MDKSILTSPYITGRIRRELSRMGDALQAYKLNVWICANRKHLGIISHTNPLEMGFCSSHMFGYPNLVQEPWGQICGPFWFPR